MSLRMLCGVVGLIMLGLGLICPWGRTLQAQKGMLTQDQAIAALRSKAEKRENSTFSVLREIKADSETKKLAQLSLEQARVLRVTPFRQGVFVSMLQTGGFIILETNSVTNKAVELHLVTRRQDGLDVIESERIDGELSPAEVARLSENAEALTKDLFQLTSSSMIHVAAKFLNGKFPTYGDSGEESYFAIPRTLLTLKVRSDEVRELGALSGALQLWPIRCAISMPAYSADPGRALEEAREKRSKLVRHFLEQNGRPFEFFYELQDLESIDTPAKFAQRVDWLGGLDSFLDEQCPGALASPIYNLNASISMFPLKYGVAKRPKGHIYMAMTLPGLITYWERNETGKFELVELSQAE